MLLLPRPDFVLITLKIYTLFLEKFIEVLLACLLVHTR